MSAVCKFNLMKNMKAKQASLLNENYNQVEFKERLSNEGDKTLVSGEFEKLSCSSHREE